MRKKRLAILQNRWLPIYSDRSSIAFHEAGHVLVSCVLNFRFFEARIPPQGLEVKTLKACAGYVSFSPEPPDLLGKITPISRMRDWPRWSFRNEPDYTRATALVVSFLAGSIAETFFAGEHCAMSRLDIHNAAMVSLAAGGDWRAALRLARKAREFAEFLIEQDWPSLERIARWLIAWDSLTYEQAQRLIQEARHGHLTLAEALRAQSNSNADNLSAAPESIHAAEPLDSEAPSRQTMISSVRIVTERPM